MTAQTQDRNVAQRAGDDNVYPVAAGVTIYEGALVVMAAGFAEPGKVGLGLAAVGVAMAAANNALGANGAVTVNTRRGAFDFAIDATDPVTLANVQSPVFITDDNTVCATSAAGTKSVAGILLDVNAAGCAVVRIGK